MLDTWMYIKPAAWEAYMAPRLVEGGPASYAEKNVITGYWLPYLTDYQVYNAVFFDRAEIDAIAAAIGPDFLGYDMWTQGSGVGVFEDTIGQPLPARVLEVQTPHGDGTLPTYETPNFGHVFLGQTDRVFARSFTNEFSEEFI